jgi:hypothetical protein
MSVETLHATYVRETGMKVVLHINRHWPWEMFALKFTEADLVAVCRYLKNEVKRGKRQATALMFSRLITNLDTFEEELQLVRAAKALFRRPSIAARVPDMARDSAVNNSGLIERLMKSHLEKMIDEIESERRKWPRRVMATNGRTVRIIYEMGL